MPAEKPTPMDLMSNRPALVGPIPPSQLWRELTPTQQRQVRQTIVAICQQWLALVTPDKTAEEPHDE
jgi:hypothetical protein